MMKQLKDVNINVVGFGFVGGAMGYLCEENKIKYSVYDLMPKSQVLTTKGVDEKYNFDYYNSLDTMIINSEYKNDRHNVYFICVPTNSTANGDCDISIVESVLRNISSMITKKSIVVVKSTVSPGVTRVLNSKYSKSNLDIVFCPEFLRELTYKKDILNAYFTIFGVHDNISLDTLNVLSNLFKNELYKHKKETLIKKSFNKVIGKNSYNMDIIIKSYEEAELFKYTLNSFLGVKVWYFNKIYEVCEKMNVDYQSFKKLFILDQRFGNYGTTVPGYHGFGFSGKCIPKECRGMRNLQHSLGINNDIFSYIVKENTIYNSKKYKGRPVHEFFIQN